MRPSAFAPQLKRDPLGSHDAQDTTHHREHVSENAAFITAGASLRFSLFSALPFILLGLVWLIVASIFAFRGDEVDKPNRMAQLYGYTVCLIALVVSLISVSSILDAVFERANPLQSEMGFGAALTSFEAYKATHRREQTMLERGAPARPDTASDATLRQQYEALVKDRIATVHYRTTKSLTTSTIFFLIALGLFVFHWRWVRRLNGDRAAAA